MGGILSLDPLRGILSEPEPQPTDGILALTANPMLMRQVAAQRAANPRPNITDVFGYGPNWTSYAQNFNKNIAENYPTDSPEAINRTVMRMALNVGPLATVFHGSPHLFDKFDMSKIGTGEGAQAYGHGLYFAENPGVARTYAADRAYVGQAMSGKPASINYDDPAWIAQKTIDELGDPAKARAHLEMVARTAAKHQTPESSAAVNGAIDLIASGAVKPKGALYKVDLPDEQISKMINWDQRLTSEQADKLARIAYPNVRPVRNVYGEYVLVGPDPGRAVLKGTEGKSPEEAWAKLRSSFEVRGSQAYQHIANKLGQEGASEALAKAGIPGIKYLDQGSRVGGKGTSNFVVFDDQIPKIIGRE